MIFRQLFDQESSTYTYLIASGDGREAVIIDPVKAKMPLYMRLFSELKLKLVIALDTHLHADHITATGELHNQTDCQIIMGSETKAEFVSRRVKEGEVISIDGITLKAIYTPGHTDDSYCFLWENKVFTGDTLLIRGTGRTDFQNGDARAQYDSLFNKLLKLPQQTLVYPAHDYHGQTCSTIDEEKQFNLRLQVNSVEQYVTIMDNLNLPKPRLIDIAVPANLKCGLVEK